MKYGILRSKIWLAAMTMLVLPLGAATAQTLDTFEVIRTQDNRTIYIFPKGYAPNIAVPAVVGSYVLPTVAAPVVASPGILSGDAVAPLSYYYGAANTVSSPSSTSIILRLPSNAEVWIQGKKMDEKGTERLFNLPSLNSGKTYDYEVRVSWPENGQTVSRTSHLNVRFGDQQSITYVAGLASKKPAPAEASTPMEAPAP